jgi:hypothetical protein
MRRELSKAEFAERYDFIVEFLSVVAANDDRYPAVKQATRALLEAMEQAGLIHRHPPAGQGN